MSGSTVNLGLTVYSVGVDGATPFYTFLTEVSGSPATSNMNIIDTFAGKVLKENIEIIIGDGTTAISSGIAAFIEMPYDFTLSSVKLFGNVSGTLIIDIWKDTYANFPPTVADTVVGTSKPTLSSSISYSDALLTGWNTSWLENEILVINVDSAATVSLATLSLKGFKV